MNQNITWFVISTVVCLSKVVHVICLGKIVVCLGEIVICPAEIVAQFLFLIMSLICLSFCNNWPLPVKSIACIHILDRAPCEQCEVLFYLNNWE